ncbi:nibrin isoform X2 [Carcharodon carcharias]|uniref:nibrin isoform X2 n=1 Tax=Carcharodon carcharias TaxID=13397 RepID=UPI001B7DBE81|nr:nibrin isoform X2 [Carcharodon carcharias]
MWSLVPIIAAGEPYRLLAGVDYVVGRKNCVILLHDDQSISRSHAALSVSHPAANLTQAGRNSVLTLKDTSKYGTFVNEERLQNDSPRILQPGELITFGVFQSKFRVEYEPLIVCSSCLDGPGKIMLNRSVQQLGGHLSNNWTEANTHLVMSSVKITVKTICAMICCRPIVKPEFFVSLTEAIRNRQRFPSPESFTPPIDEPSIRPGELDISIKPERKSIFRGKTFFLLNGKQHKRLNSALTLGGGAVQLFENCTSNVSFLEVPGSCVIDVGMSDSQTMSSSAEKWIESVMKILQRKGLRAIPEAEIGLAVLHNSTDVYCNPHQKPDHETCSSSRTTIPGPSLSQNVDMVDMSAPYSAQVTAYVPDTQPSPEHSISCSHHQWGEHPCSLNSTETLSGMNTNSTQVIKETPEKESKVVISQDISVAKETSSMRPFLPADEGLKFKNKVERQTFATVDKKSSTAARHKNVEKKGDICSQKQSLSLHDFFQPVGRKREREETGSSQAKFARAEEPNLPTDHELYTNDPSLEKRDSKFAGQRTKPEHFSANHETEAFAKSLKERPGGVGKIETSSNLAPEKTEFVHEKAKQKRIDPEDENVKDDIMLSRDEQLGANKRRKVEHEGLSFKEEDEVLAEGGIKASTSRIKQKSEIKHELPASLDKESNNYLELLRESENNEALPSRLLLTVFKSLVVSQPGRGTIPSSNAENSQLKNFKKFKKVLYPGAEELPKIIGGTDLKAYQTKKNSEMEEWLRQEVEEQSQQAKEDNLADDLFRYDPKSVKRRR